MLLLRLGMIPIARLPLIFSMWKSYFSYNERFVSELSTLHSQSQTGEGIPSWDQTANACWIEDRCRNKRIQLYARWSIRHAHGRVRLSYCWDHCEHMVRAGSWKDLQGIRRRATLEKLCCKVSVIKLYLKDKDRFQLASDLPWSSHAQHNTSKSKSQAQNPEKFEQHLSQWFVCSEITERKLVLYFLWGPKWHPWLPLMNGMLSWSEQT